MGLMCVIKNNPDSGIEIIFTGMREEKKYMKSCWYQEMKKRQRMK